MGLRSGLIVGALWLAACGSSPSVGPSVATSLPKVATRIAHASDIEDQLGRRVHIVGQATNTDHGPTIVNADLVVYMEEYRPWSGPVVGKRVEAEGVIARDNATSSFVRVVNGEPMTFLRDASYRVVE